MFTGIVEDTGRVVEVRKTSEGGARFVVSTRMDLSDTKLGDSIAVDGCCLTVVEMKDGAVSFDLGPETLKVTKLGTLAAGSRVHLERALRLSDRLGGHMVAGHVDAVGTLERREHVGDAVLMRFSAPRSITKYCIHKGSITVDGVSLTVNAIDDVSPEMGGFEVGLIPHTLEVTHLGDLKAGDPVNLEADLIGKYVERLLGPRAS